VRRKGQRLAARGFQFVPLLAGRRIPDADSFHACRGQRLAVRGEDYRLGPPWMVQLTEWFAGGRIPKAKRDLSFYLRWRGQRPSGRREGDGLDLLLMRTLRALEFLPRRHVPKAHRRTASRSQHLAVRREGQGC